MCCFLSYVESSTALRIMTLIAWKAFAQVVSSLFLTPGFGSFAVPD